MACTGTALLVFLSPPTGSRILGLETLKITPDKSSDYFYIIAAFLKERSRASLIPSLHTNM
jgi:hypothetical protein